MFQPKSFITYSLIDDSFSSVRSSTLSSCINFLLCEIPLTFVLRSPRGTPSLFKVHCLKKKKKRQSKLSSIWILFKQITTSFVLLKLILHQIGSFILSVYTTLISKSRLGRTLFFSTFTSRSEYT